MYLILVSITKLFYVAYKVILKAFSLVSVHLMQR